jgi:hypothetical protein
LNVLTKIFIVLMSVFSIVLVSVIVPFVANQENYREQRDAANVRAAGAMAQASLANELAANARKSVNDEISGLNERIKGLNSDKVKLAGERDTLRGSLASSRADLARTQADIANMASAVKQYATIQVDLQKELAVRRTDGTKLARQVLELENANNEFQSQVATMRRHGRLSNENLISAQEEIAEHKTAIAMIPKDIWNKHVNGGDSDTEPPGDVTIRGQVTDVRTVGEDTTLVQINVGSNDGVKERMRFVLHRGEGYLASIVILSVDEERAAGRITISKPGGKVAIGDQAWTGPSGR